MNNQALRKLQAFCVVAAATVCALAGAPYARGQAAKPRLVTQAVDESKRVTLRGNVHPLARAEFDQGAIADTQPIHRIYLLLNRGAEQQAALDKLMREQVDASSPNFHKWLTPEDFGAQFGPSEEDVTAVKSWLSSHGFTGMKTNNGRTIVEFNGTVGTVRSAFATDIHRFVVRGEEHFANVSEPQIPAALANVVIGVTSLHNFRKRAHIKRFGKFRRDLTTGEITPLFTFTDVNGTFFGMGPADFAKIYNIPAGADGTGQSIAIVARSNINPQDVTDFRSMFGLPAYSTCNLAVAQPQLCVILNGADPGLVSGDEGEADLDVEWSGAVAPAATIKFVASESSQTDGTDGVDASAVYIVDNNIAPVMSESFGSCEVGQGTAGNAFQNALWEQAAAEGITVSVSAGDNGSAGCDDPNAESSATKGIGISGTASTPFNVAVGGTDFDQSSDPTTFWSTCSGTPCNTSPATASAKGYIPEIPWNDSCATGGLSGCNSATTNTNLNIVGGSGGPSAVYTKTQAPFQSGFGDTQRDIPDVSFFAADGLNKSFYIVCESDQDITGDTGCSLTKFTVGSPCPSGTCFHDFQTVGGTSASAPAFAGVMALVNQSEVSHGRIGRQGNANFVLYALAKTENFASCNSNSFTVPGTQPTTCVFMDITKSNNAVPCVGGSPNCSKTSSGGNGVLQTNNQPAFTAGPPTAAGYDLATGLGSINVTALLNLWGGVARPAPATTLSTTTVFPITHGATAKFTVAVSPTAATGDVSLVGAPSPANEGIGPFALSGGAVSISTISLAGGTYQLKAHYAGDATHAGADSNAIAVTVNREPSKTTASLVTFTSTGAIANGNATTAAYGSPYVLRVDVTNAASNLCYTLNANLQPTPISGCPTGAVSLKDNGNPLDGGNFNLNQSGFFEDQPIQLPAGSHPLVAAYAGDNSFVGSTSATNTITITQAPTQVQVALAPITVVSGGMVTLTATVTSGSNADAAHAPTGTVQFSNGATNLGAPVTCTPAGATASAGASCTATVSATISAFPPVGVNDRWRWTPLEWFAALLAMTALALFVMAMRMRGPRRAFAYGAMVMFLIASATLAGCGGGSSGGGGGGGGSIRTITAKYSGDTNYATSTGSGTVTVQ